MMFQSHRLTYRALQSPQDDEFLRHVAADPVAKANSTIALPKPPTKAGMAKNYEARANCLLDVVICLKPTSPTATPVPIGQVSLHEIPARLAHHRQTDMGVGIIAEYQGQGYGSEAIEWALQWGFVMAGLHRIEINCFSWNEGAAKLYEKLGFVPEGRRREIFWFNGKFGDDLIFGMLEHEWKSLQAKKKGQEEK